MSLKIKGRDLRLFGHRVIPLNVLHSDNTRLWAVINSRQVFDLGDNYATFQNNLIFSYLLCLQCSGVTKLRAAENFGG